MKRFWTLIGPAGAIVASAAAVTTLGLGGSVPRWVMFAWPVITVAWSLNMIIEQGANRLNRKTIEWQAKVIRNQAELIDQIFIQDFGGRE